MGEVAQEQQLYPGSRLSQIEIVKNILFLEIEKLADQYLYSLSSFFGQRSVVLSATRLPVHEREALKRQIDHVSFLNIRKFKTKLFDFVERECRFSKISLWPHSKYFKWHLLYQALRCYERIRDYLDTNGHLVPRTFIREVDKQRRRTCSLLTRLCGTNSGGEWQLYNIFGDRCILHQAIREIVRNYNQTEINRVIYGQLQVSISNPPPVPNQGNPQSNSQPRTPPSPLQPPPPPPPTVSSRSSSSLNQIPLPPDQEEHQESNSPLSPHSPLGPPPPPHYQQNPSHFHYPNPNPSPYPQLQPYSSDVPPYPNQQHQLQNQDYPPPPYYQIYPSNPQVYPYHQNPPPYFQHQQISQNTAPFPSRNIPFNQPPPPPPTPYNQNQQQGRLQ